MEANIIQEWKLADSFDDCAIKHLYKCAEENCSFTAMEERLFRIHIRKENHTKICCYCFKNFGNAKTLALHVQHHHTSSIFQCGYCVYRTSTYIFIQRHHSMNHWNVGPMFMHIVVPEDGKCEFEASPACASALLREADFKQSVETIPPLICYTCGYRSLYLHTFHHHMCTGEVNKMLTHRPACQICVPSSEFVSKDELISHYQGHKIFQYHCLLCEQCSTTYADIVNHSANFHPEYGMSWIDRAVEHNGSVTNDILNIDNEVVMSLHSLLMLVNSETGRVINDDDSHIGIQILPNQNAHIPYFNETEESNVCRKVQVTDNGKSKAMAKKLYSDDQAEYQKELPQKKRFRKALDIANSLRQKLVPTSPTDGSLGLLCDETGVFVHTIASGVADNASGNSRNEEDSVQIGEIPHNREDNLQSQQQYQSVSSQEVNVRERSSTSRSLSTESNVDELPSPNTQNSLARFLLSSKDVSQAQSTTSAISHQENENDVSQAQSTTSSISQQDNENDVSQEQSTTSSISQQDNEKTNHLSESPICPAPTQITSHHIPSPSDVNNQCEAAVPGESFVPTGVDKLTHEIPLHKPSSNSVVKRSKTTKHNLSGSQNRTTQAPKPHNKRALGDVNGVLNNSVVSQSKLLDILSPGIETEKMHSRNDEIGSRALRSQKSACDNVNWKVGYGDLLTCWEKYMPFFEMYLENKLGEMLCCIQETYPAILDDVSLSLLNGMKSAQQDEHGLADKRVSTDCSNTFTELNINPKKNFDEIGDITDDIVVVDEVDTSVKSDVISVDSATSSCELLFTCRMDRCPFQCREIHAFIEHLIMEHRELTSYPCGVCGELMPSLNDLQEHYDLCHSQRVNFSGSSKSQPTSPSTNLDLNDELRRLKIPNDNIFKHIVICSCGYETKVRSNLLNHMRKHVENQQLYNLQYCSSKKAQHNVAKKSSLSKARKHSGLWVPPTSAGPQINHHAATENAVNADDTIGNNEYHQNGDSVAIRITQDGNNSNSMLGLQPVIHTAVDPVVKTGQNQNSLESGEILADQQPTGRENSLNIDVGSATNSGNEIANDAPNDGQLEDSDEDSPVDKENRLAELMKVFSPDTSTNTYVPEKYLYQCCYSTCKFIGVNAKDLTRHFDTPHTDSNILCKHCHVTFKNSRAFQYHLSLHGPALYKCSMCVNYFAKSLSNVERHCISFHLGMHNWGKENVIMIRDLNSIPQEHLEFLLSEYEKCNSTALELPSNATNCFKEHEYNNNFVDTSKKTADKNSSESHVKTIVKTEPTDESNAISSLNCNKPKQCSVCCYAAFSITKVKKHINLYQHYYYQCNQCDYQTYKYKEIIQHLQDKHQRHDMRKNFHTTKGTIGNSGKEGKVVGLNIKAGSVIFHEELYYCPKCPAVYFRKSDLETHLYTKFNYMKYKCAQCDYAAASVQLIQTHTKRMHNSNLSKIVRLEKNDTLEVIILEIINQSVKVRRVDKNKVITDVVEYQVNHPKSNAKCKYQCLRCKYGSNFAQNVQVHISRKHRSWHPFQCAYCSLVSSIKADVKTHIRKDHPGSYMKYIERDIDNPSACGKQCFGQIEWVENGVAISEDLRSKGDDEEQLSNGVKLPIESCRPGNLHENAANEQYNSSSKELYETPMKEACNSRTEKEYPSPKVMLTQLSPNSLSKHVKPGNLLHYKKSVYKRRAAAKKYLAVIKDVIHSLKENIATLVVDSAEISKSVVCNYRDVNVFDATLLSLKVRAYIANKEIFVPLQDLNGVLNFNSVVSVRPLHFRMLT